MSCKSSSILHSAAAGADQIPGCTWNRPYLCTKGYSSCPCSSVLALRLVRPRGGCRVQAKQPKKKKQKSHMGVGESFTFLAKSPYIRDLALLVRPSLTWPESTILKSFPRERRTRVSRSLFLRIRICFRFLLSQGLSRVFKEI